MGLFNRKKEGGMMDAIRCDEKDFLIWKWRPDRTYKYIKNQIFRDRKWEKAIV